MSRDAEVSDGFQGGVQEKANWVYFGLLKTTVSRTLCKSTIV